jgi:pimeloyl-ACP methyl ester carboxylesterase
MQHVRLASGSLLTFMPFGGEEEGFFERREIFGGAEFVNAGLEIAIGGFDGVGRRDGRGQNGLRNGVSGLGRHAADTSVNVFSYLKRVHWVRILAIGLAGAYLVVGLTLYFEQGSLLFPAPKDYEKATPEVPFEDLRIAVNQTDQIHAWWIPAASDKVVLMFHGNGHVLEDMARDAVITLHEIGANLLLVDYRGYGGSTPVAPRESSIQEDARAALRYLGGRRGVSIERTYVLGRSIGSGPATQLAVENPGLAGLILESPFSSIDDAARAMPVSRFYPMRWLLRTHFDNLSKIGSVRMPVLIVCGSEDTLTPIWMARAILNRANEPKRMEVIPGAGHNDLVSVGGKELTKVLRGFVRSH